MKLIIIGGGPGGYVAAIRAAQLGADVTLVEKEYLGGVCLNVGCIPTKALLNSAGMYKKLSKEADQIGLLIKQLSYDWDQIQNRKEKIVRQLTTGVHGLLKSNHVEVLMGKATFVNENQIEVTYNGGGSSLLDFDYALVATGSKPLKIPIAGVELTDVLTSNEALALEKVPKSMVIIGGGVIGSEFASIYSSLGTKVTIVEALPRILMNFDKDITKCLVKELEASGVEILTATKVDSIEKTATGLMVQSSSKNGTQLHEVENVLLAVGRKPLTQGLGLEKVGVKLDKEKVLTNKKFQTNIPHIYAVGDCRGEIQLAHVASAEGIVAVENMMGLAPKMDFRTIPAAIYTAPEIASVGLTEEEAKRQGYDVKIGRFPLYANGKALILSETNGLVKFTVDRKTEEILGLQMAGPHATELIVEGALALRLEATIDEILTTIHAHPTVGESLLEAAHAAHGYAIHLPK